MKKGPARSQPRHYFDEGILEMKNLDNAAQPHATTGKRSCQHGVRSAKLETVVVGGHRLPLLEAIDFSSRRRLAKRCRPVELLGELYWER
jgi:hypothetical protein